MRLGLGRSRPESAARRDPRFIRKQHGGQQASLFFSKYNNTNKAIKTTQ